jgi:LacI family transcriptional regulator
MQPRTGPVPLQRRRPVRSTITQVAREAGVAIATVSGILNSRADCYASQQTRQRVQEVARRLGYRPSLVAHALHGRAIKTLGLLVPAMDVGEVVIRTMASFEATARQAGFLTVTACTQDDPEKENDVISALLDRHADGIVMYPTEQGPHKQLRHLAAEGFPIVTLDGAGRLDFPVDDVSISQYDGGRLQAEHLIELGCRRACLMHSVQRRYVNDQKMAGLKDTLARSGFPAPLMAELDLAVHTQHHWDARELDQIREFLRAHRGEFDALVAVGDVLAVSAMRCAIELGLRVPEDLVVIGFNDIVLASEVVPSLTTVHDPAEQMGSIAFQLLEERLRKEDTRTELRQVKIQPTLCVRMSTARQPAAGTPRENAT